MTLAELADVLEKSTAPDQGLHYHNGSPKRRYDPETGEPYTTRDPTELNLFGSRANNFYAVLNDAKNLAALIRAAIANG